tara:strand:- start:42 stop:230 length:189 start_codon:yes stop_codon:yes gene_type:complete
MADEKKKTEQPSSRQYLVGSEQLMDIMRYLMTRPYGEVVKLMNSLSSLMPYNPQGEKDVDKK